MADVHEHALAGVRMPAFRHDEFQMLNQLARVRVREAGEITGPALRRRGIRFQPGDRIVVRDN